jgi:hypothetical protein
MNVGPGEASVRMTSNGNSCLFAKGGGGGEWSGNGGCGLVVSAEEFDMVSPRPVPIGISGSRSLSEDLLLRDEGNA